MAVETAGTTFTYGGAALGGVQSINGPNVSRAEIDITDLSSTAREYMQGLDDGGTVTLEGFLESTDAALQTIAADIAGAAGAAKACVLTFPTDVGGSTATSLAFNAVVLGFTWTTQPDDAVRWTIELRVSGAVTPTWGT